MPSSQLALSFAAKLPSKKTGTRNSRDLEIEPLDATFRDSRRAPLHSWFPFLEGYSPHFVKRVLNEYLPQAQRIIEPFTGSGTTPIVLSQTGIECAYSEVNPAMAFVAKTKLKVLRLSQQKRHILSGFLRKLAAIFPDQLEETAADLDLQSAYDAAFGPSVFFDSLTFEQLLRIRKLNDAILRDDLVLGECLTLAVIASLIPCSRLERAGDLRFKTKTELAEGLPLPAAAVQQQLLKQANDLPYAAELKADTFFACDTASGLYEHIGPNWDGVITSPPYLNGTNYIRNSRLELWYLRYIADKVSLRRLRDRVVTSGINDVDAQTDWAPVSGGVEKVVRNLQKYAYDVRIPKMVGGYFKDMSLVLTSIWNCIRSRARVCIDIGDSIYAGVHVPTDDLLVEVAEQLGFKTIERVHLRKRISKGGQAVRQQLLVFEKPPVSRRMSIKNNGSLTPRLGATAASSLRTKSKVNDWKAKWERFKASMPHQAYPFARREWGGPAHSMCSFQGKMKPALAHHLIECFSDAGNVVVDPFSGAGTIPFEACRMGRNGFGVDISRLGHVLTLAKVAHCTPSRIEAKVEELGSAIRKYRLSTADVERAAAVRYNSSVPDFFHPDTLREILAARRFFLSHWDDSPEWALVFACTLHLLHGNRPYALSRRSHPVTPFKPTGPFEYRPLIPRLNEKLTRLKDEIAGSERGFGTSAQADCTKFWPSTIPHANAIITSPPFFDSTRFYMTNWMRFWFVGWEREDFDKQPKKFIENRQKKSLDVYKSVFENARERICEDGIFVLHLGQSHKCDMGTELTARIDPWFKLEDNFTEDVEHCESHGIRDKGTVHGHTFLVLTPK